MWAKLKSSQPYCLPYKDFAVDNLCHRKCLSNHKHIHHWYFDRVHFDKDYSHIRWCHVDNDHLRNRCQCNCIRIHWAYLCNDLRCMGFLRWPHIRQFVCHSFLQYNPVDICMNRTVNKNRVFNHFNCLYGLGLNLHPRFPYELLV